MSVLKRPIGRRVTGAVVGATLMVLGLAAPAFAAPVVSGISPTSGPVGCVVVITGTGFDQPGAFAIDEVNFTGAGGINTEAALFHVVSDTEIWTTVPGAATTGAITVADTDPTPDATANSAVFTVTTDEGGCGPTITSFAPTCGVVGTVVTITGTNLLSDGGDDSTTPATAPAGGDVRFNPYSVASNHTGAAESPTTLVVNVPGNAVDGPIRVDTSLAAGDDNVDSTASFDVVTNAADCGDVGVEHARTVTLRLRKHLVAKGTVTADPELAECIAGVKVKIQRKKGGAWKSVGTATTNDLGKYKRSIKDKPGKYRARIGKTSIGDPVTDVCLGDRSPVVRHSH